MAGRPPKPTALKLLQGTARPDRVNADEPQPTPGAPRCPTWLKGVGRAEWRRIVPELERLGLLTHADMAALAGYCQAYADLAWAVKEIEATGRVYETRNKLGEVMFRQRPEMGIAREAAAQMRAFLTGFGLDPASRTRLHATPPAERDPFEEFMGAARRG